MTDIYKVATLNINDLALQLRITMLEDFLIKQEITSYSYRKSHNLCSTIFEATQRILTQERPGEERLS